MWACISQLSSEESYPATDGSRWRDPQSNNRQSQGNYEEEEKKGS